MAKLVRAVLNYVRLMVETMLAVVAHHRAGQKAPILPVLSCLSWYGAMGHFPDFSIVEVHVV